MRCGNRSRHGPTTKGASDESDRGAARGSYLLRYPEGAEIPPHTDPVQARRHYRLNIVLKASPAGGEFVCATPIFATRRIKLFRPDACEHSVTRVLGGSRYVLSIGWVLPARQPPG